MVKHMDLIDVSGDSRQIGRGHGEQRRDQIARELQQLDELAARWHVKRPAVLERFDVFRGMFERVMPESIDEMAGIAEGAGRRFEEILFLNARHGGIPALEGEPSAAACTSFAAAGPMVRSGGVLAGQNKDTIPSSLDRYFLLRTSPTSGPRMLALTYPGEVGGVGINSFGVGVFSNALFGRHHPIGGPHNLVRRAVLECRSVDEAHAMFGRLEAWCEANYLVADGTGKAACFEVVGGGVRRVDSVGHLITHGNHVLNDELLAEEDFPDRQAQSAARAARLEDLLRAHDGRLTWHDCARSLADHEHGPHSICRHGAAVHSGDKLYTTSALVADLENLVLHLSLGHPCQNRFEPYGFN